MIKKMPDPQQRSVNISHFNIVLVQFSATIALSIPYSLPNPSPGWTFPPN